MQTQAPGRVAEALDFEQFFQAEYGGLVRSLYLLMADQGEAEELAQETMARVFERWDKVRTMASPGGYMYRIAINLNRKRMRHLAVRARRLLATSDRSDPVAPSETRNEIAEAIALLTGGQRQAFMLVEWLGMTAEEWPLAAVTSGLVFRLPDGRLEVWNPETGAVIRRLPVGFPVATHRSLLAWCSEPCDVLHETHVEVGGGETIDVRLPAGTSGFDQGVFSPDGETIAVSVHTGPLLEGLTTLRSQLALVVVRTGTARLIAGTAVEGSYAFVDWSPSGDAVFITGGSQFAERSIIEYDVETGRARRLSVEVGDFYGMAAA